VKRSKKPVYWCPTCVTSLAEAEVEYESHVSPSITVKFAAQKDLCSWLEERFGSLRAPVYVLIWTTTPWTLPANLAVALHPDFDYVVAEVDEEIWILAEGRLLAVLSEIGKEKKDIRIIGRFRGQEIENLHLRHPFIERESLIINAPYVTLDAGTGCVHTAPGHGADDYESGLRYGLDVYSPVDDHGRFTEDVPDFAGEYIFDANDKIIELLRERKALVSSKKLEHSYPHCWRCKKPVIFRATAQWFISMEHKDLRKEALEAIEKVSWIPSWGEDRIKGMVEGRPDWCISRQRAWGVPITIYTCEGCEEPFMNEAAAEKLVSIFQKEGADAWFAKSCEELLPEDTVCPKCGSASFKKEMDILDVWFDSGVSHAAVLEAREGLSSPADLYLEGSDQHRGWFQSSLLTSVATRHRAPYRSVLTHGFVVDGQGKKMSKSVGNVIAPEEVIKRRGAEVLRLWVSAEDYRDDIKISDEILQRLTDAYRKIRNTVRYLLSNISDFDPAKHQVDYNDMEPLDLWALARLNEVTEKVVGAYNTFQFHTVFHQLYQYCTVDLSALYLDIIKDRLYCEHPEGRLRRSAQTVVYRIAHDLLLLMAPVLSFTAEEAWAHLPGGLDKAESIFMASMPKAEQFSFYDEDFKEEWRILWDLRAEITKALELARKEKRIGLALDALVRIRPPEDLKGFVSDHLGILRDVTIVSQMELVDESTTGDSLEWKSEEIPGLVVYVSPAKGKKCARCWTWSTEVGNDETYRDVCGRCAGVLHRLGWDTE